MPPTKESLFNDALSLRHGILMAFTIFPSHGQGTLVILLDVFQNPTEEDDASLSND